MKNAPCTPDLISSPLFSTSPPIIIIYICILLNAVIYIKDLSYFYVLVIFTISIYTYAYELIRKQSMLSNNLFIYLLNIFCSYVSNVVCSSVNAVVQTCGCEGMEKKRKQYIQRWTALCEVKHSLKRKHNNCYRTPGLYRRQDSECRLSLYEISISYIEKLEIFFYKMVSRYTPRKGFTSYHAPQ